MPQGKNVAAREDASEVPSIGAILSERSAWFTAFGLFCGNYYWYFLITWLPAYLEKERHFPKRRWRYSAGCHSWRLRFRAYFPGG